MLWNNVVIERDRDRLSSLRQKAYGGRARMSEDRRRRRIRGGAAGRVGEPNVLSNAAAPNTLSRPDDAARSASRWAPARVPRAGSGSGTTGPALGRSAAVLRDVDLPRLPGDHRLPAARRVRPGAGAGNARCHAGPGGRARVDPVRHEVRRRLRRARDRPRVPEWDERLVVGAAAHAAVARRLGGGDRATRWSGGRP